MEKEPKVELKLTIDGKETIYNSIRGCVLLETRNKVFIECECPKNWALTRIFQFMESLIKAEENLI